MLAQDGSEKVAEEAEGLLTSAESHELDSSEERKEKPPYDNSSPNHFRGTFFRPCFGRKRNSELVVRLRPNACLLRPACY